MAKVEITPILADSIKTLRMQKGISSRGIASAIGRSPSYFSKIENGSIKSIDKSELDRIFDVITGDDRSLDKQIDSLYATLKIKYSAEEIKEDLWFHNYDTVWRFIPVPVELVDDINRRIAQSQITVDYLVERINGNDDVPSEYNTASENDFNEWKIYRNDRGMSGEQYIKMSVSTQQIEKILTKNVNVSNYVTILGIAYYLTKIENYQDLRELPYDESERLMECTVNYLNSYKFYSLSEKERLLSCAVSTEDYQSILNSFDKENMDLINEMLSGFKVFSELNVEFTNKQLTAFIANLHWDASLMLNFIGIPFSELGKMSFTLKQEMLTEIKKIVKKYQDIPDNEKGIETYT